MLRRNRGIVRYVIYGQFGSSLHNVAISATPCQRDQAEDPDCLIMQMHGTQVRHSSQDYMWCVSRRGYPSNHGDGAEEMDQCGEWSLGMHEDLSLDQQHPHNTWA